MARLRPGQAAPGVRPPPRPWARLGAVHDSSTESHFIDGEADDAAGALSQARRWLRLIGPSENVATDLQAVADRLRGTRTEEAAAEEALAAKASAREASWARTTATAAELEYLATLDPTDREGRAPVSLISFMSAESRRKHRLARGHGIPGPSGLPGGPPDRYWSDLLEGAREVWEAVQPLPSQIWPIPAKDRLVQESARQLKLPRRAALETCTSRAGPTAAGRSGTGRRTTSGAPALVRYLVSRSAGICASSFLAGRPCGPGRARSDRTPLPARGPRAAIRS